MSPVNLFVSAVGCHCFDLGRFMHLSQKVIGVT